MSDEIRVLIPEGRAVPQRHALASRLRSFEGAVIAVLDNTKPNADVILTAAAEALIRDHGAREYRLFSKPNPSVPFLPSDQEALTACDLLLTGTGD